MRDRIVMSLRNVHPDYHEHRRSLTRLGFQPEALMTYGLFYATHRPFGQLGRMQLDDPARRVSYGSTSLDEREAQSAYEQQNGPVGGIPTAIEELRSHILHDIVSSGVCERDQVTKVLHTCLDHVDLIDRHVIPHISAVCGTFDHTVRFEKLDGDNLTISIERPVFPTW